jgi:hypothetical protein
MLNKKANFKGIFYKTKTNKNETKTNFNPLPFPGFFRIHISPKLAANQLGSRCLQSLSRKDGIHFSKPEPRLQRTRGSEIGLSKRRFAQSM